MIPFEDNVNNVNFLVKQELIMLTKIIAYYKFTKEQLDLGYSEIYPHKYLTIFETLRRVDLKSLKNFEDV